MPTKGADEYAVAELKNGVICSGVGHRVGHPGSEGIHSDCVEIGRCDCQD